MAFRAHGNELPPTPPSSAGEQPMKRIKIGAEDQDEDDRIDKLLSFYPPLSSLPTPPLSKSTSPQTPMSAISTATLAISIVAQPSANHLRTRLLSLTGITSADQMFRSSSAPLRTHSHSRERHSSTTSSQSRGHANSKRARLTAHRFCWLYPIQTIVALHTRVEERDDITSSFSGASRA